MKNYLLILLTGLFLIGCGGGKEPQPKTDIDIIKTIDSSNYLVKEMIKENKSLEKDIQNSLAVAIFPNIKKMSYLVGGEFGDGVLLLNRKKDSKFSHPLFIGRKSLSFGLSLGYKSVGEIIVINNEKDLNNIFNSKILADAAVNAGSSKSKNTNSDEKKESKIYVKSLSGAMADLSIKGITITPSEENNLNYYGKNLETPKEFEGFIRSPYKGQKSHKDLLQTLNSALASSTLDKLILTAPSSKEFSSNDYALIIGINKYKNQSSVPYADNSANSFKNILTKRGFEPKNIITILNEDATSGEIKYKIEMIKELAEKEGKLIFYFAGHGVPGVDENTYILPYDMGAEAIHLESNLNIENIYKKLQSSSAEKILVFMDSCFSGKDDRGDLLYKGVAPVFKRKKYLSVPNRVTVMTAGQESDFANANEKEQQRLFSYYLIKAMLKGKQEIDSIYDYVKKNVKIDSLHIGIGHKQIPQLYKD